MKNLDIHDHQLLFAPLLNVLQATGPVPETDQRIISDAFVVRTAKANQILLRSGNIARELFFIVSGILKITSINEKGNQVTQFFLKENQFCSILSSLNGNIPAEESIVCACDCDLLVIKNNELIALYKQLPYFEHLIKRITTQTLLNKIQTRNAYMGEDASTRYKKFIGRQPDIALRVPLVDIASYLGITQQSLSRIRRNVR
ncbi:MAG TPA: Crp/Fnr family transcriptional regulator [Mucilaginibacter sp.]|nr:Crp/Fnr family transcriptional regulator [Mucilaginibacter sp.]